MSRKKRKKDGLASKVWGFEPVKDERGKYIPYCDFGCHRGIIVDEDVCVSRSCTHYFRLYIDWRNKQKTVGFKMEEPYP